MMRVPGFLLRRLYVKNSLRNRADGFEFDLKNSLGSGYAQRMLPMAVDDGEVPLGQCSFSVDKRSIPFVEVSPDNPFTLALNRSITIVVQSGAPLAEGPHRISMGFEVRGLGRLRFDFTDAPCK